MDNTTSTETTKLLTRLESEPLDWPFPLDLEQAMMLLVQHQSEFPAKIREAIRAVAIESDNPLRIAKIYDTVKSLFLYTPGDENDNGEEAQWGGLDSQIDTEEEVKLAIRFFKFVLRETKSFDGEGSFQPIFCAATSLKSLPFVPLLAELGDNSSSFQAKERGGILKASGSRKGSVLLELLTNKQLLQHELIRDEDFDRKLDETSLQVLIRLKEIGLLKKDDIWDCIDNILFEKPSRTEKRLRFLIDWNPTILKLQNITGIPHYQKFHCTSLLEYFLHRRGNCLSFDDKWKRFQTLLEMGMFHHPEQMGFLFDGKDGFFGRSSFKVACEIFENERVMEGVNGIVLRGFNERLPLDGLFFLTRRNPTAMISLLSKAESKIKAKTSVKNVNSDKGNASDAVDIYYWNRMDILPSQRSVPRLLFDSISPMIEMVL